MLKVKHTWAVVTFNNVLTAFGLQGEKYVQCTYERDTKSHLVNIAAV